MPHPTKITPAPHGLTFPTFMLRHPTFILSRVGMWFLVGMCKQTMVMVMFMMSVVSVVSVMSMATMMVV